MMRSRFFALSLFLVWPGHAHAGLFSKNYVGRCFADGADGKNATGTDVMKVLGSDEGSCTVVYLQSQMNQLALKPFNTHTPNEVKVLKITCKILEEATKPIDCPPSS